MNRLACLTALAVLFALPAHAQAPSDGLPPPLTQEAIAAMITDPDFHTLEFDPGNAGTLTHHTVITTAKTGDTGNMTTIKIESSYDLAFRRNGDDYDVTKTMIKSQVLSFQSADAPAGSPQASLASGMANIGSNFPTVTYTANGDMLPLRLTDWPGVKTGLVSSMHDLFKAAGAPSDAMSQIEQIVASIFGQLTPESAASTFLPADSLIAIPHNVGLVLRKPLRTPSQVAAPIGGVVLDAVETMELTTWDEASNTAHVTYDFVPTPASINDFMTNGLPVFMKQLGAPESAIADFRKAIAVQGDGSVMKVSTHCDFDIAIDSGLVTRGTCAKSGTINIAGHDAGKTEQYEFSESRKN